MPDLPYYVNTLRELAPGAVIRNIDDMEALLGSRAPTVDEGRPGGATIPVTTLCDLAHAWWHDRLAPDWRPHTTAQNQAILEACGLVDPFWQLG